MDKKIEDSIVDEIKVEQASRSKKKKLKQKEKKQSLNTETEEISESRANDESLKTTDFEAELNWCISQIKLGLTNQGVTADQRWFTSKRVHASLKDS